MRRINALYNLLEDQYRNDSGDLFARSTQNEIYSLACQVFGHTANFGSAFEHVVIMNHHQFITDLAVAPEKAFV